MNTKAPATTGSWTIARINERGDADSYIYEDEQDTPAAFEDDLLKLLDCFDDDRIVGRLQRVLFQGKDSWSFNCWNRHDDKSIEYIAYWEPAE